MNYYQHHIGDYAAATAYLSLIEDAIYTRLLRVYYRDEKPLPADTKAVAWLIGLRSKKEVALLENLLPQFFVLQDDGWHNLRADEEISAYRDKQGKAKAAIDARWSKAKEQATEGTDAQAKPYDQDTTAVQGSYARDTAVLPAKYDRNTNQEPLTNNQEPKNNTLTPSQVETAAHDEAPIACVDPPNLGENPGKSTVAEPEKLPPGVDDGEPLLTGKLARLLRQLGVQVTPHNPDFRQWVENGLDADELTAAVEIARSAKPKPEPIPWGYLAKVMLSQRKAKSGHVPARQRDSPAPWEMAI